MCSERYHVNEVIMPEPTTDQIVLHIIISAKFGSAMSSGTMLSKQSKTGQKRRSLRIAQQSVSPPCSVQRSQKLVSLMSKSCMY